jgi:hypothetical protein
MPTISTASILNIVLQFFAAIVLCAIFFNILSRFDRKLRPQGINSTDLLKEIRIVDTFLLLSACVLLIITITVNIFYKPLVGFYLVSALFLFLGSNVIIPAKGRKIADNCWVAPHEGRNFIVTLNDHAILIKGNWIKGKPEHIIFRDNSPRWLPPHAKELVSSNDYEYILTAIVKYLKKHNQHGKIQPETY